MFIDQDSMLLNRACHLDIRGLDEFAEVGWGNHEAVLHSQIFRDAEKIWLKPDISAAGTPMSLTRLPTSMQSRQVQQSGLPTAIQRS